MQAKESKNTYLAMRITSAVVGLALLGAAIYLLTIGESDRVDVLFALGISALGLAGVVLPSPFGGGPKPPSPPLAMLALAITLAGCADPIGDQARAAVISADVLSAGGEAVSLARGRALDRVEEANPTDPEHDAALEREAARWRPVGMALDEARVALAAWVDALELARVAGADEAVLMPILRVAGRAVQLTIHALDLAAELGVEGLPTIPPLVLTAANAIGGR